MYDEHFTFTEGAGLCCIVELKFLVSLLKLKITYANREVAMVRIRQDDKRFRMSNTAFSSRYQTEVHLLGVGSHSIYSLTLKDF